MEQNVNSGKFQNVNYTQNAYNFHFASNAQKHIDRKSFSSNIEVDCPKQNQKSHSTLAVRLGIHIFVVVKNRVLPYLLQHVACWQIEVEEIYIKKIGSLFNEPLYLTRYENEACVLGSLVRISLECLEQHRFIGNQTDLERN